MTAPHATPHPTHGRSDASGLPRPLRVGALLLAALVVALAAGARIGGGGHVTLPGAVVAEELALLIVDGADGSVAVLDARTRAPVAAFAPGEGAFVRGVLRALARGRRLRGIGADAPFRLARWADGRITLADPATGAHVELAAFGTTNAAAFVALLPARR
ncbi:MAG: photosynthetic complex assembly protein PuhC [Gemmatirosa sp.]